MRRIVSSDKKFTELLTAHRGVLLDIDNTLYPYEPCHAYALEACFLYYIQHIKKISLGKFRRDYLAARESIKRNNKGTVGSRSRYLYFQAMLERQGSGHIRYALALGDVYERAYISKVQLSPRAKHFLKNAKGQGIKVVLISNQEASFQYKKIKKLKIEGLFDRLVTSDEAGAEKPDKRIFDLALAKIGLKPDDVVMLGDDPREDGAARRVGIRFIHVAHQFS